MVRGCNDLNNIQQIQTLESEPEPENLIHDIDNITTQHLRCLRDTVILNVGGTIHQVRWETIEKFPKSRLHSLRFAITEGILITFRQSAFSSLLLDEIITLCDSYSLQNREFFFDRSPRVFEYILGIYRKGELHLPSSMCPRDFLGELDYWGLSALHLGKKS